MAGTNCDIHLISSHVSRGERLQTKWEHRTSQPHKTSHATARAPAAPAVVTGWAKASVVTWRVVGLGGPVLLGQESGKAAIPATELAL